VRSRRAAVPFVLVALAGVAATGIAASAVGMGLKDGLQIGAIAAGAALAGGLAGGLALAMSRGRSIGTQTLVVVLTAFGAVAAGTVAAGLAMFLAPEDVHALIVILLAAGTTGTLVSLILGRRVIRTSRLIGAAASHMGQGGLSIPERPTSAEFAALARELESVSRRLEQVRASERSLDASRRELVAWVSHDLRTPLAGIRAMAEALEDGVADDPATVARYHRMLRAEAERLAGLVDDLFELSVLDAGALRLTFEPGSWADLVSDAVATASVAGEARGVRVEGHMANTPPPLPISAPELGRALRNVLDNAVRHTPPGSAVTIAAGADAEWAFVSVADTCGGIPEADLPRVFDPAFRGEAARTPGQGGGVGLGLAIAKGIVEAHGGRITVANEGRGCRFVLEVPAPTAGS
jgi:signal transduction histidine kinase